MTWRRSALVGAAVAGLHFVASISTLMAQGRTLGLEAPENLSLGWPWALVSFPVVPIFRAFTGGRDAWFFTLVWLLALNSALWGIVAIILSRIWIKRRGVQAGAFE